MSVFLTCVVIITFGIAMFANARAERLQRELERVEGNVDALWQQMNDLHPTPLKHPRETTRREAS
jgi:sulfite exporter TauE/SafE